MNIKMKYKVRDILLKFLNMHWNSRVEFGTLKKVYYRPQFTNEIEALLLGVFFALGEEKRDVDITISHCKETKFFAIAVLIEGIGVFPYERSTTSDWQIIGIDKEKETHDRTNKYPELSIPQE